MLLKMALVLISIANAFFAVFLVGEIYGVAEAAPDVVKVLTIIYVCIPPVYLYKLIKSDSVQ